MVRQRLLRCLLQNGITLFLSGLSVGLPAAAAADWPMWRYDAARTNKTPETIPDSLHLKWKRTLPPVEPAFRKGRLQFDQGYEPIVAQGRMFVALPHVDAVVAYAIETGKEAWCFYADGPVRLAPVYWNQHVYFGSDDGNLYCVNAATGRLKWKFRAVPSQRKLLGNGRMISVWPLRGGPVVADGIVYFAAGVWPLEGIFVYAVNAETGDKVWVNDRTGSLYGHTPHGGQSIAGLTPQGYLLVNGDELVVPCGTARPATFDRRTGQLRSFNLPKERNNPGGWFMATDTQDARDVRRGKVHYDSDINQERHEGKPHTGPGTPGIRSRLTAGEQVLQYAEGWEGVDGKIHCLLVADGHVFVVTLQGDIYAFGSSPGSPQIYEGVPATKAPSTLTPFVSDCLKATRVGAGYALALGTTKGRVAEQLVEHSDFHILALTSSKENCDAMRERNRKSGIHSDRLAYLPGRLTDQRLPPWFADLVVTEDLRETAFVDDQQAFLKSIYDRLRPYGGVACLEVATEYDAEIADYLRNAKCDQAVLKRNGDMLTIRREGALPGAVDYTKNWTAPDDLVRAPLGILWFDDSLAHFKRAPQPEVREGIMISQDKKWRGTAIGAAKRGHYHEKDSARFTVSENRYADVYTGRVLSPAEASGRFTSTPAPADTTARPPYNYRPPFVSQYVADQKAEGKTLRNLPFLHPVNKGEMVNPITGQKEPRRFVKSYGCDGGNDYGHLITMRSATPAFYDKRIESGTINISGPRSGCTNSVIPANGVLSVPFFYDGCSCSYPLPTGAGLVSMPQTFEQWTAWGDCKPEAIVRIGVNLGAPGDRMTNNGTLFVDYPNVGGPSPEISITTQPEEPSFFYHHSLFTEGGEGWPWVCASGSTGLSSLRITGLKKGEFTIRLYFLEPECDSKERRVFDVAVQGNVVLPKYDIFADAGGQMRCVVKTFLNVAIDDACELHLNSQVGQTLLCGIELVSSELPLDEFGRTDTVAGSW